ncbi:HNH endonuclease [Pseudomonas aeruginosa]|nr:HNH endonuclease [Pseudomonas aeruginosa]
MTEWREVVGYEGLYRVSEHGEVIGVIRKKIKKQFPNTSGYMSVGLCANGRQKNTTVHKIVALAFLDKAFESLEVNHIDGDKLNNHHSNLEWVTRLENLNHAKKMGLLRESTKVVAMPIDCSVGYFFVSINQAVKSGFNNGNIYNSINGKSPNHKGFNWAKVPSEMQIGEQP